uniref:Endonuclease/exonuclease/phosphatase domain-containing protein n=1 Tax=Rousettus aegyptiacus TaxID=9407 RepID=A0A7J8EJR4_ROUAE|nr:hypothetical protein HJG63_012474 [Rousettus aegyptiacus]
MIKGSIQQEDITFVNIYATNIGAPKDIKQILTVLKEEINSSTIIVGDFNTPLTSMDRSSRQKVNKEASVLNDMLDKVDLTDIYRKFHSKATEYIFFSSAHGTFSKKDNMLGYKTIFKFKRIEIMSRIFSNYNDRNLEMSYMKKTVKFTHMWRLNNMLLNN